jgi:hypothetical protein
MRRKRSRTARRGTARVAEMVLHHYEAATFAEGLADLLADARHFADTMSLDFAEVDRMAYAHYAAERADARRGGPDAA